jgi:hypothetical protein
MCNKTHHHQQYKQAVSHTTAFPVSFTQGTVKETPLGYFGREGLFLVRYSIAFTAAFPAALGSAQVR